MDINYLGRTSFKIKTKLATIVINPESSKLEADIFLYSKKGEAINTKIINRAGEYEIGGVSFMTFKDNDNLISMIEAEGLKIVHTGNLTKEISSDIVDEIGAVDILMVNVLDTFNTVEKIDPYFIIPMGYPDSEKLEVFNKAQGYIVEKMPKLTLKKEDITEDLNTKIVELEVRR